MLRAALELCEDALAAGSADLAAAAISAALRRRGASYVQVRLYHRPAGMLTNDNHWAAGGVLLRSCASGWEGSAGFDYVCFRHNPLLTAVRHGYTRYRFSDFAPHAERQHGEYWEAFSDAAIADGVGANAYAISGRIASIHVGLPTAKMDRADEELLLLAAGIAAERIARFEPHSPKPAHVQLSARERDVMTYVAIGKTDWEVGAILGIAASTVRFHADNVRRKLHAANRTHAVARFIEQSGLS